MKFNILSLIVVFGLIHWVSSFRNLSEKKTLFVPPATQIQTYSFGYNSMISSLMWVRVLQDINICDQTQVIIETPANFESSEKIDPVDQVLQRELPQARCEYSWVFQMLDVISNIDPTFLAVYTDGATFLSVLVDDRVGAQKIFERGLLYYPDNWEILYRAAYHELFEMQNPTKAAELLNKAGYRGAPKWVFALSARIMTRLGQAEFAKTILESVLARKSSGFGLDRVKGQLEKVNEIIKNSKEN